LTPRSCSGRAPRLNVWGDAQRLIDEAEEPLSELPAESLPITNYHAVAVAELEPIHGDPFDRMLITKHGPALLFTADEALEPYGAAEHVIS
jgi:PIN domain nuclease of toxin-antitoxin system